MPSAIRRSKFSLETNHASSAVATPSAFRRSEAPDAGIPTNPNISSTAGDQPYRQPEAERAVIQR
jgi:hypothetical protein